VKISEAKGSYCNVRAEKQPAGSGATSGAKEKMKEVVKAYLDFFQGASRQVV